MVSTVHSLRPRPGRDSDNEVTANCAVLAFAFIASLAAGAAAADPEATTSAAAGAPPQTATPPKKHGFDPNTVICKSEVPTGTMFAKKVCLTSAQWDQTRQEDIDALRRTSAVPQAPLGDDGALIKTMPSATLRHLVEPERGVPVHFDCSANVPVAMENGFWGERHKLSRHYGWTLTAAEALERWGADTTLDDLERRGLLDLWRAPTEGIRQHPRTDRRRP
jgi:hypothetical protein